MITFLRKEFLYCALLSPNYRSQEVTSEIFQSIFVRKNSSKWNETKNDTCSWKTKNNTAITLRAFSVERHVKWDDWTVRWNERSVICVWVPPYHTIPVLPRCQSITSPGADLSGRRRHSLFDFHVGLSSPLSLASAIGLQPLCLWSSGPPCDRRWGSAGVVAAGATNRSVALAEYRTHLAAFCPVSGVAGELARSTSGWDVESTGNSDPAPTHTSSLTSSWKIRSRDADPGMEAIMADSGLTLRPEAVSCLIGLPVSTVYTAADVPDPEPLLVAITASCVWSSDNIWATNSC